MPAPLLAAAAYVAGTLLAALLGGPWWVTALLAALIALAASVQAGDRRAWLALGAAVALAAAGHAHYDAIASRPPPALAALTGTHELEGVARDDARRSGRLAQVDLSVERVDGAPAAGGLRLTLPAPLDPLRAGERLRFTGRIEPPPAANDFDYAAYLGSRGIYAVSAYPVAWERLGGVDGGWRDALRSLRRQAVLNIERALPEPEAALAAGVLLGERGALPAHTAEQLRVTGTTHLVVVSGQNIAMLLGVAIALLAPVISRRRAAIATLALLFPYVVLVGGDPPVVRSAIMAVGIALAAVTGRRTPGWVYLLDAVAIMLAVDPLLARDVAFQLSATATAGVMVIAPALRDGLFARFPRAAEDGRAALVEVAATATGAALAVLPVQAAAFDRLAPWSIPANILVAPLYEATFALAAVAAALGWIAPAAAAIAGAGRFLPAAFLGLVALIARLPAASLPLTAPLLFGALFYAALGGLSWWLARRGAAAGAAGAPALAPGHSAGLGATVALATVAGGLWIAVLTPPSTLASVTVLDVGQGLAVLVRDGDRAVLIDTGPPDAAVLRALPRAGAGRAVNVVLVTHRDTDHAGGLRDLELRLAVGGVRASRLTLDAIGARGGNEGDEGDEIDIGDRVHVSDRVTIEVLGPPVQTRGPALAAVNNGALVLLVTIGERRILVPSDIEAAAEAWLVRSGQDLRADVLLVPHHGSRTSSTPAFLDAVQPAVAVVSVGARNPYGHPAPEVMARYERMATYRTDEVGDVTLRSDGTRLWVATAHARVPAPTPTPTPSAAATARP